jgi:hypothetical protein
MVDDAPTGNWSPVSMKRGLLFALCGALGFGGLGLVCGESWIDSLLFGAVPGAVMGLVIKDVKPSADLFGP